MKTAALVLAVAALPLAAADELVMKDGRTVEWSVLRDLGEEYEVETPKGARFTVRKDDVERLAKTAPKGILTGASFTFAKTRKLEAVDLAAKMDPKLHSVTEGWRKSGGSLVGTGDGAKHSRIEVPGPVPEEYDLSMTLERKEGDDELAVILASAGRQAVVSFDWARGAESGLVGGPAHARFGGRVFENRKPRAVLFMVRRDALVCRLDGKDWFVAEHPWGAGFPDFYRLKSPAAIGLAMGGAGTTWQVSRMVLTSPKP